MSLAKRITLIALFIVLSFTTLGTVTYAWLSVTAVNTIDILGLGADDVGLELSLDGVNFSRSITDEDLKDYIKNVIMKDITSTDGVNFTHLRGENAHAMSDYISFDVYFRSSVNTHIYLVDDDSSDVYNDLGSGTAVVSEGVEWGATNRFLYAPDEYIEAGEVRKYYASDSIRISMIEQNVSIYGVNDLRNENQLSKRIIDPSGELNATTRGYGVTYGAFDIYNIIHPEEPLSVPDFIPETVWELTEFYAHNQNRPMNDNTLAATLQDTALTDEDGRIYRVGKTRINIWLEGYDADTLDAVFADSLQIHLKFKSGHPIY